MAKESKIITNLKSVRESTGMTQQELADLIGMRRETILHLENNRKDANQGSYANKDLSHVKSERPHIPNDNC